MTGGERSGWRDEWMSRHHRSEKHGGALTDNEPMTDIDCVEVRYGNPVAIIDWKFTEIFDTNYHEGVFERCKWSLRIQYEIAIKLDVPFYILFYNEKSRYWLYTIENYQSKFLGQMNEEEWIEWEKNLGRTQIKKEMGDIF